jgi:hypothetical protein
MNLSSAEWVVEQCRILAKLVQLMADVDALEVQLATTAASQKVF